MNLKRTAFLVLALWPALPTARAYAVEVSLEENKAERGNIGYVDLQAIFRIYPETQKAKQNFEDVVRQSEDQVNVRKLEVYRLEAELTQMKTQREFLLKNPNPAQPPQLPGMEANALESSASLPLEVAGSTIPAAVAAAMASKSTQTAAGQPISASTQAAPGQPPAAVAASSAAATTAQLPITSLPGLMAEATTTSAPAASTVTELDGRIADTSKLLDQKQAELKTYEDQVEKNLLDLESRRTEIILGKIYSAVQAVAQAEGVSVVIDKSQILFGHKAVDLTPKVLERLKGS